MRAFSSNPYDIPYEALLFDMDGVIVDTEKAVTAFWQGVAERFGVLLKDDQLRHHVYGRPAHETLDALFPAASASERQAVMQEMGRSEEGDRYQAVPGVLALLQALRATGIPLALVTSGEPEKVSVVEEQLGLETIFAAHVTARDIRHGKPDPECYLLAAKRLGVPPGSSIVFEDAISGVQAAIAAGMRCIGVGPSDRVTALRTVGAGDVIPDFAAAVLYAENSGNTDEGYTLCLSRVPGRLCVRLKHPDRR